MELLTAIKQFIDTPFTTPMDMGQLVLLVGLVMVLVVLWSRVLAHLTFA